MPTIVVHVMPKPEILDPQGKAVGSALARLGFSGIESARQGKRFELTIDGEVTDAVLEKVREAAASVLSNPVIEDVVEVTVL
jgi:phosphoribosylformylglycinamidine synthase